LKTQPNILWICTDQQRFDTIHSLGNEYIRTPTVDGLVENGVTFTHAHCQSPICTPSRSSFMTGLYPSRLHNTRNGNGNFPSEAPALVSKLIADAGYDCGLIGKFHLLSSGKRSEPRLDDGFSSWQFSHAPRDDWPAGEHDYADWVRAQGADLNAMRETEERVPAELHQTTWAAQRAIEFIEKRSHGHDDDEIAAQPWMLNINLYDPHPPFIPPKAYADRYDPATMPGPHYRDSDVETQAKLANADYQDKVRTPEGHRAHEAQARYYAMIELIDDQLARLLKALDASGQRENTVIVFTSDHGEALGDHGLMYKGCRFYEGLVRVPLIFEAHSKWGLQTGLKSDALVELLDLSATLLELAGVEQPPTHQGHSLLPIMRGAVPADELRDFVRCEYFDALASEFTGGNGAYATMHRTRTHKLSVYHSIEGHVGELYDMEADPWEHNNLWDSPDAKVQALKNRMILDSFNAHVNLTTDVGGERIAPM